MAYIEARKMSFTYPKGKRSVINDISIKVFQKDITAITGHNGGGKTTLGKLLGGILKPLNGSVLICGRNSRDLSLGQIGKKIGYLFQNPSRQIFTSKVEEEILFISRIKKQPMTRAQGEMEEILRFFDLYCKKDEYTFNLSYGEKQRLALGAILVNKPEFLILDEPTTGLDKLRKDKLSEYLIELNSQGVGMIIISHDMDFIDTHASRRIEVEGGRIIYDER